MEGNKMKVVVLSGKGGTGKTLISVNLAASSKESSYIDCDIEEPNGHLFFKPIIIQSENVMIKIPMVDEKLCKGCRECVDFCKFNALAFINNKLIVFDEICHACGGCVLFCPEGALTEKDKIIGFIQRGVSNNVNVMTGVLNIGEASGVLIINQLLSLVEEGNHLIVIDCPPGSGCNVMESIKDVDYCVLVAEPTLFGAHNLNMVYELVNLFRKPHGVVLNKCLEGENPSERLCKEKEINILMRIPFDNELGKLNSSAHIAVWENKKYQDLFTDLLDKITREVELETITNP